jgi:hypothetical protein
VYDVDGDGLPEVMAVNPDQRECSELMALSASGETKKTWRCTLSPPPYGSRIGLYEWVVVDLNGNGDNSGKIIVASFYASYSMNSEQTVALDMQQNILWHRREFGEGEWGRGIGPWSAYSLLQRQGQRPTALFLAKDYLCQVDVSTGEFVRDPWILWRATNSVMNQPDWDFDKTHEADFGGTKDPFTAYGSPILVDMDHDGREEILIGGCFGGFGLLRDDYTIVWWMQTPFTDMMLRLPGVADVFGDGNLCVGICRSNGVFHCLEGTTGRTLWSIDLKTNAADVVTCDIDGDGREEFIVGTTDGRLLAIGVDESGQGTIRWSVPFGYALGSPVVADVDGDGASEVLVVTGDGSLVCIGAGE